MSDQTYHDALVAHAAEEVRAKSPKMRKAVRQYIAGMKASRCFPNNLGGYPGKRPERPLVAPLEPAERFARLKAAYLAFAAKMKERKEDSLITLKRPSRKDASRNMWWLRLATA